MTHLTGYALILILIHHISALEWLFSNIALPVPVGRELMGINTQTSNIYLFGGAVDIQCSTSICCQSNIFKWDLNNQSSQWITINSTTPTKCFWSIVQNSVTIENMIYFIGVQNGTYKSRKVYVFDITTEQFINNHGIPPTPYISIMGCLSTNKSHIFIIGGYQNANNKSSHDYIQILNVQTKQWKTEQIELDFLQNNDGWFKQTCVMIDNVIYIFGGAQWTEEGDTRIQGIYKYHTTSSIWSYVGNMSSDLILNDGGWAVYHPKTDEIYFTSRIVNNGNNINSFRMNAFHVTKEEIVWFNKYPVPVYSAPILINNDTIMMFGGNLPFNPQQRVYRPFVQMADIQFVTSTLSPTSSPTTFQPSNSPISHSDLDSGVSIQWTIIICINSIFCILIVFIVIKCAKSSDYQRNYQLSAELASVAATTYESVEDDHTLNSEGERIKR